jgi:hypothetical protein
MGPDPVLAYVCKNAYLESFLISRKQLAPTDLASAEKELTRFSAGSTSYTVRRAYGAHSVQARQIKQSRFLMTSVDLSLKRKLDTEIEQIHNTLRELKDAEIELKARSTELENIAERFKEQRVCSFNLA